jgi:hypothetical protein
MNIYLLVVLSCLSLFVLWIIIRVWYGKKLRENIARRKGEIEKLEKEIHHKKEMKKHLGYHAMEREEFTPSLSEEEKELTEGQIQDEDEELEQDGL